MIIITQDDGTETPVTGETLSEALAYRTAASAFLASKQLIGEFDAWCAERGLDHSPEG